MALVVSAAIMMTGAARDTDGVGRGWKTKKDALIFILADDELCRESMVQQHVQGGSIPCQLNGHLC